MIWKHTIKFDLSEHCTQDTSRTLRMFLRRHPILYRYWWEPEARSDDIRDFGIVCCLEKDTELPSTGFSLKRRTPRFIANVLFNALDFFPVRKSWIAPMVSIRYSSINELRLAILVATLTSAVVSRYAYLAEATAIKVSWTLACEYECVLCVQSTAPRKVIHSIFDALGIFPEQKTKKEESDE